MLEQARKQRIALKTATKKLQCLSVAKAYLKNTFKNSLQHLSDTNYWRNTFKDQLNVDYREFLLQGVEQEMDTVDAYEGLNDLFCKERIGSYTDERRPIK